MLACHHLVPQRDIISRQHRNVATEQVDRLPPMLHALRVFDFIDGSLDRRAEIARAGHWVGVLDATKFMRH